MTVGEHFKQVAGRYESLRTTDEAPVRRIRQLLPDHPVTALDIGDIHENGAVGVWQGGQP